MPGLLLCARCLQSSLDARLEISYRPPMQAKKPLKKNMKILTTLPVGTSLQVEKVQRTVGLLGFPWDYAIVQVVVSARNPKEVTAQKLLNYDYENPFGGHQAVIQSKEGTAIPCINRN